MSEIMDTAMSTAAASPFRTEWRCKDKRQTFSISAFYDTYGQGGSCIVRAATPKAAKELIESLANIEAQFQTLGLGESSKPAEKFAALRNQLSEPFAVAVETWSQNLPGSSMYTKTYPSGAARGKATASDKVAQLCIPITRGVLSKKSIKATKKGKGKETAKTASNTLELLIEVTGLRHHVYHMDGELFSFAKPGARMVKIGTTGILVSPTGGEERSMQSYLNVLGSPWHSALEKILNISIGEKPSQPTSLPIGQLSIAITDDLKSGLLKLGLAEARDEVDEELRRIDQKAAKYAQRYKLDLVYHHRTLPEDPAVYSQHALYDNDVSGPQQVTYYTRPRFSAQGDTLSIEFQGCLTNPTPSKSDSARRLDRFPSEDLLVDAITRAVYELNYHLEGGGYSVHPSTWWTEEQDDGVRSARQEWFTETLMAAMSAHIFRAATPAQLHFVDIRDGTKISAVAEEQLSFKRKTVLKVTMDPTPYGSLPKREERAAIRFILEHGLDPEVRRA